MMSWHGVRLLLLATLNLQVVLVASNCLSNNTSEKAACYVDLYERIYMRGRDNRQMKDGNVADAYAVSSLEVPPRCCVEIFEFRNFGGKRKKFCEEKIYRVNRKWSHPVSSFKISMKMCWESIWERHSPGCVRGRNIRGQRYSRTSVEKCKKLCEIHPKCESIEYGVSHGGRRKVYRPRDCVLNSGANPQRCNGQTNNLDLYVKKSSRLVQCKYDACKICKCYWGRMVDCSYRLSALELPVLQNMPSFTESLNLFAIDSITTIDYGSFDSLPNLKKLGLRSLKKFCKLPDGFFNKMNDLEELDIYQTRISSLHSGTFQGLRNLLKLVLSYNRIEELPAGVFGGLNNLKHLQLNGNPLKSLKPGIFQGLGKLETLEISSLRYYFFNGDYHYDRYEESNNRLQDGLFQGLHSLRKLDLSKSRIVSISPGAFRGLENLRELKLGNNLFRSLPADCFAGLTNLQILDLSGNKIKVIGKGAFDGLESLENLNVKLSHTMNAPENLFQNFISLQVLDLSYNHLIKHYSNSFRGLKNLRTLDLWSEDPVDYSLHLSGIKSLKLTLRGSATLKPGVFDGMSNLENLTLNLNSARIEGGTFRGLVNLKRLDMGDVDVDAPHTMFEGLPSLTHLILEDSWLKDQYVVLLRPLQSLTDLELGARWVACKCRAYKVTAKLRAMLEGVHIEGWCDPTEYTTDYNYGEPPYKIDVMDMTEDNMCTNYTTIPEPTEEDDAYVTPRDEYYEDDNNEDIDDIH